MTACNRLLPPTSPARALAFAPTGGDSSDEPLELVSAHTNGDVRQWGLYQADGFAYEEDVASGHHDEVTAVAFRPDGHLLSVGYDGEILWWGRGQTGGLVDVLPTSGELHASDVVDVWLLDDHGADVVSLDLAGRLIDTAEDIDPHWFDGIDTVGLTAGASAPEELVQEVMARLDRIRPIEITNLEGVEENVRFKLPDMLWDVAGSPYGRMGKPHREVEAPASAE